MTIQGRKLTTHTNVELTKPKKVKRRRRKVKKSKSLYSPAKIAAAEVKPDELSADLPKKTNKASETTKDSKTKKILNRKRSQPSGTTIFEWP